MSDIDYITDLSTSFAIKVGDNPQEVTGNRLLLNIFECTFLTDKKSFTYLGDLYTDQWGGDASRNINHSSVLSDPQAISAAVILTINETVKNMKSDETDSTPPTERIIKAELNNIDIVGDSVSIEIQVFPVEIEPYVDLVWRLPIIDWR
jgi:hypothetical protein